jgi:hypothetical protein
MPNVKIRIADGLQSAAAYRQKAVELCASANKSTNPIVRVELESLAFVYMRLAETAERNAAKSA